MYIHICSYACLYRYTPYMYMYIHTYVYIYMYMHAYRLGNQNWVAVKAPKLNCHNVETILAIKIHILVT